MIGFVLGFILLGSSSRRHHTASSLSAFNFPPTYMLCNQQYQPKSIHANAILPRWMRRCRSNALMQQFLSHSEDCNTAFCCSDEFLQYNSSADEDAQLNACGGSQRMVLPGVVYMVATPIGNLNDVTLRAVSVLRDVDVIAAEDTRRTSRLLQHFAVPRKMLLSHHEHNWRTRAPLLVELALSGKSIAVVSDAGTPGIADPGVELVRACTAAGVRIEPVPGPCALATALSAAGFPAGEFTFFGFVPARGSERRRALERLLQCAGVAVFYEAPHRVLATLGEVAKGGQGARRIVVARELTKLHEEFFRGDVDSALQHLQENGPRGEFTLVLDSWAQAELTVGSSPLNQDSYVTPQRLIDAMLRVGVSPSAAGRAAAEVLGLPRNAMKRLALERHAAECSTGTEFSMAGSALEEYDT